MAVQGRRHARPDVWMLCIFRDAQDATWFRSHVSSHAPVPGLRIAVVWKPVAVTPFADGDAAAVALTPLTATASPRSFAPASPTPTPMPSPALDRPVDLRAWCRTRASGLVTVGPVDAPLDLSDVLARLGMRYNPPPQPPAATGPATAAASASLPLPDGDHDAPRLRKYTVQRRGRPHTVRVPLRVAASGPPRLVDGVYAACRSPSGRSCRFVGAL
ncbi:hypothetical protein CAUPRSCDRAFT_12033 [Caulochytrium protostelioides]|nr:hypothetical protein CAUPRSCDRAFT_12033 [Caulochytrium protostelioides]